jgi:hypothetical protein
MWLCSACGLAQLVSDPGIPEEPKATEPAALTDQAAAAVDRLASDGWLSGRTSVAEFESPHGGSWFGLLAARGIEMFGPAQTADVVLDCFGFMHAADQRSALAERVKRVAPGGVLLLQYHSLNTIIRLGQWNALRHGHFAYYSTVALTTMLARHGFTPRTAWTFDLYGGTVLLAATREVSRGPDEVVERLLLEEKATGVTDIDVLQGLQLRAETSARVVHDWLVAQRAMGRRVVGYGAASRAISLLLHARVDSTLLSAVVDASPAKHGRRMPGTDIPIVSPARLESDRPDVLLLMLPDLMAEVRSSYPEVESSGGEWVDVEALMSEGTGAARHATSAAPG